MKRFLLMSLILLLGGCSSYPDKEVVVCKDDSYNMMGDGIVVGSMNIKLSVERGYITEEETTVEIPLTPAIEALINREYQGDRAKFLRRLTVNYWGSYVDGDERSLFTEENGIIRLHDIRVSEPLPDDWRSWIIPKERNIEFIKNAYFGCK